MTEERCFHDIIDFTYWFSNFSNSCYVLKGFRLDEYTEKKNSSIIYYRVL